jgi:hypothetical protein
VTLILLVVLSFPRLIRPDLSDVERDRLAQQGTDKLVAAENDRSNAQNSVRTTLLQGIAGVALLTGAYFAYRGLEAGRLQLKATEDGQITTRYTEAVKQLGDKENDDIRIGGIYALQRIARDSDRDLPTVVALLSAFVRRSAPVKEAAEESSPEGIPLSAQAPDVEIALRVLAELGGAHLSRTNFDGANLYGADLHGADLHGADLRGADLRGGNLRGADLRGADLRGGNLRGASLIRADLRGADFRDANLISADLRGADLGDADLRSASIYGAVGVDLRAVRHPPPFRQKGPPRKPVRDRDHDGANDGPKQVPRARARRGLPRRPRLVGRYLCRFRGVVAAGFTLHRRRLRCGRWRRGPPDKIGRPSIYGCRCVTDNHAALRGVLPGVRGFPEPFGCLGTQWCRFDFDHAVDEHGAGYCRSIVPDYPQVDAIRPQLSDDLAGN